MTKGLGRIPSRSHNPNLATQLAPRPDPNSTFQLDLNQPVVLRMHDPATIMVVTLRSTREGMAQVQFSYYPSELDHSDMLKVPTPHEMAQIVGNQSALLG